MRKAGGELRQTKEGEETQRREDDVKVAETRVMPSQPRRMGLPPEAGSFQTSGLQTVREYISVVLSHQACSGLLQ